MAHWIFAAETPASPRFYDFTKEFNAPAGATLTARISGDTRYALYLNDRLVSEGPCQGSAYQTYYETEDLTPYLRPGKNILRARVLYVTKGFFISVYRREQPALWFDGTLTVDGEITPIATDGTWTCTREDACTFHNTPGVHTSIPPCEDWSGAPSPTPVELSVGYEPDLGKQSYNIFGLSESYILRPRPIPQMETEPEKPLIPVRRGEGFLEFDAGAYTTAKVRMSFKAPTGVPLRFIYAESYSVLDANGNRVKNLRDAYDDPTAELGGQFDTVVATGEAQTYAPFWYRSFRFVRVEFPADCELDITAFTAAAYHYPLDSAGHFICSDERFNRMWEISRNTVLACMHEMYVDCPYYEQQQYQMDSALEMLFTLRMSADSRMPFKSITDLGHSQMADGMLQANYPSTMVQIIPDFTFFWILMLRDYLRYTANDKENLARIRSLSGTVDKALEAFEPYRTESGLIGATPYWHFVDWVPAWFVGVPTGGDKEPLTVTSLMYATALHAGADIADAIGRPGLAADYRSRAADMIATVQRECYDPAVGLYRDLPGVDSYSQHTTLWAILSGAVTGEAAGELVDRTFDGHVPVHTCTFSMSHYMFRALEKADRYGYAARQMEGWQRMLDWHCTTWCENPDSPRSECHGWSSAPIYEFSAMVLGVTPTSDGYGSVRVKPYVNAYPLDWASGTVPTPHGVISVYWKKEDGLLHLEVILPDGVDNLPCEVILPDGTIHRLTAGSCRCACEL